MSEETKVAVRLLVEAMNELRLHAEADPFICNLASNQDLKRRVYEYFLSVGMDTPEKLATEFGAENV